MRMIPSVIADSTVSNAERRLFELFNQTNISAEYVCLHSLDLPSHEYKILGELDFVIVSPRGLYVLEVKGGGVSCQNGIWYFQDRHGNTNRKEEGPFHQARSGMFSLRQRLLERIPESDLADMVMGFGVVFPDCEFDVAGVEWDQEIVLDARRLRTGGTAKYISDLEKYWHQKFPRRSDRVALELSSSVVKRLRPDFEMVRSLQVETDLIENRMVKLTEEQYSRLDIIEDSARILVSGGAGTGKTFLATEVAQRHARSGEKVLLVCFSPLLAAFPSTRSKGSAVSVSSITELMLEITTKHGELPVGYRSDLAITDPWYMHKLVPAFEKATRDLDDSERYDVLVIDEAQDVLNLEYLTALGNLLKGGIEQGRWRIFYDPFNQGPIFGVMDSDVVNLLLDTGPVPPRLRINCRNTNEIVIQTKLITGADLGSVSTGPGPAVQYSYFRDNAHAATILEGILATLRKQEIPERQITILSPLPFADSSASQTGVARRGKITVLDDQRIPIFPFTGITFSTIANFKGLENRFVILTDIKELDSTLQARALLYVGMSRARAGLWVILDESLKEHHRKLSEDNLAKVLEDIRNGK